MSSLLMMLSAPIMCRNWWVMCKAFSRCTEAVTAE